MMGFNPILTPCSSFASTLQSLVPKLEADDARVLMHDSGGPLSWLPVRALADGTGELAPLKLEHYKANDRFKVSTHFAPAGASDDDLTQDGLRVSLAGWSGDGSQDEPVSFRFLFRSADGLSTSGYIWILLWLLRT